MQAHEQRSLVISRGITLTEAGLQSAGGPVVLGHREQFKQFVINTSASVIEVLTRIFPDPVAIPLVDGTVQASPLAAWEHYNQQVLQFSMGRASEEETVRAGQVILQWCQAAVISAQVGCLEIRNAPELLAVQYLADNGAKAFACGAGEWAAYLTWLEEENTMEAVQRRVAGYGRRDPRPAAVSVVVPWPEYLGAKLDDGRSFADKLMSTASDISIYASSLRARIASYTVIAGNVDGLVEAFDASGPASDAEHVDRAVRLNTPENEYLFRVHRSKSRKGDYLYSFRLLCTDSFQLRHADVLG